MLQLLDILNGQNDNLPIAREHTKGIILELLCKSVTCKSSCSHYLSDILISPVYHRLCLWVEDEPVEEVWQEITVSDDGDLLEALIGFLAQ
jgi:hypothetical protein